MIGNSATSYGWLGILLHWLMALAVFGLFGLGLYMVELSYYDRWYRDALALHKSIGIVLAALWLLRLLWRLAWPKPAPLQSSRWAAASAGMAHLLLYLLMIALMFSGYLISTADGRAIEVFSLFEVAALPWALEQQEDIAGEIHYWLAWSLIGLACLHGLAALKHHFVDKDSTLKRMLRPQGVQDHP